MISIKVKVQLNKEVTKDIMQKLDQGMDDLADAIFERSQELCPVDEATLKKSGHVEREFLDKIIAYDAPHAPYLEFGTDPHHPPSAPIIAWAKRKFGLSDKEAQNVGWAIVQKIAKEGSDPHPFLRPSFDEGVSKASEIISRRFK